MKRFDSIRSRFLPAAFVALTALLPQSAWAQIPANCMDILASNPAAGDGTYFVFPNDQVFQVYCKGMSTGTPGDYLTLVNTVTGANFSEYAAGGATSGTNVVTSYTKVGLNPQTLLVNTSDQTFSSSTGSLFQGSTLVSSMPYSTAYACVSPFDAAGAANIDLTGTPFDVTDTFLTQGFDGAGSATLSSNNQVVNLTGGGFCGWEISAPGMFNPFNNNGTTLSLGYIGPMLPETVNSALGTLPMMIKPTARAPAPINPRANAVIPVAILSTNTFDARTIDPTLVTFGENGTEASASHSSLEDVNGDGLLDLVLQFPTQQTGLKCGDYVALAIIFTTSDQEFIAAEAIQTVGCH